MHNSLDINSLWDISGNRSVYGYQFTSGVPGHTRAGSEEIGIQFHPPQALPDPSRSGPWIHQINESAPQKKIWFSIFRRAENYLLRFDCCGDFLVKPGAQTIECTPTLIADRHTLQHILINQVIPRMLSQLGETVLHASAISLRDEGITAAFMGESGTGKSTLAAWFCRKGASLLSDDCLRIVLDGGHSALAIPSYPTIRIWGDSRDKLVSDIEPKPSPINHSYNDKLQFLDEDLPFEYCDSPAPLTAIILLNPQDNQRKNIELIKVSQKNALGKMISNCFRLDVEDRSILESEFRKLTELAVAVPAFEIKYPKNWDALEDIHSLVLDQLDRIT
jgi:hypothetical protein